MEYDDAVKRAGRIVYIEPNNINNLHPNNSIPYLYEDYAISVNLRVYNGNRYSCGRPEDYNEDWYRNFALDYSSDNGTITFIGGTNGYLSTNFTDINMNDPLSNTHECLGIESINIAYESWFYPQVKIKFIDVRGASLMLPAEYEKYNSPESDFTSSSRATFFNSLFSFPYPMFKLSIKGFYGKEITYDLNVSDVKINFNSTTGHAEINVSFIGYMYGVYSEIPMSLISVAPYVEYGPKGKEYWNHEKNAGHFVFRDGNNIDSEMLTYPELLDTIERVGENAKKIVRNSEEGKRIHNINALVRKISSVKTKYFNFKNKWQTYRTKGEQSPSLLYMPVDIEGDDINETDSIEQNVIKLSSEFKREIEAYNKMAHEYEHYVIKTLEKEIELNDMASDYEKQMEINKGDSNKVDFSSIAQKYLSYVIFTTTDDPSESGKKVINTLDGDKIRINGSVADVYKDFLGAVKNGEKLNNRSEVVDTTGIRKKLLSKDSPKYLKVYLFRLYQKDPVSEIRNIESRLSDEKSGLQKKLKEIKKETMREGLSFIPTIRNMFNLTFAHMNTFIELFYDCLGKIKEQITSRERRIKDFLGQNGNIQCDINEYYVKNAKEDGSLPPFTMFYQEKIIPNAENGSDKTYELIWPGNLPNGENLEEVKLVRAIVSATKMYKGKIDATFREDTQKKGTNKEVATIPFYPITHYDFVHPYTNQYINVLSKSVNKDTILDRILLIFVLRCYYFFYMNFGGTNSTESTTLSAENDVLYKKYGKIEAENIFRALDNQHLPCSRAFNNKLLEAVGNVDNYVENFIRRKILSDGLAIVPEKNRSAIFGVGASSASPLKYKWLSNNENFYIPIGGTFNLNTISNDKETSKMGDKEEYVTLSNPSVNKNNFHILSDSSIINNLMNSVYHENDGGESFNPLFKNFHENIRTISSDMLGEGYLRNYLSPYCNFSVSLYDKQKNGELYNKGMLPYAAMYDGEKTDNIKGTSFNILYPSIILSNVGSENAIRNILYAHPIYYAQKTNLAKAYLFLCGIPVYGDKFISTTCVSGTLPKTILLREGALYWRRKFIEENGEDPINVNDIDNPDTKLYRSAEKDEIYAIKYDNNISLYPIPVNDSVQKYVTFTEPSGITEGRVNELIKLFEDFAESTDFTIIDTTYSLSLFIKNDDGTETTRRVTSKELSTAKTEDIRKNGVYSDYGTPTVYGKIRSGMVPFGPDGSGNFNGDISFSYKNAQEALKRLFGDFDIVIDYAVPYSNTPNVTYDCLKTSMVSFITEILGRTQPERVTEEQTDEVLILDDKYGSEDFLISVYDILRTLYNKWLCANSKDVWYFDAMASPDEMADSDFGKFKYIDNFYHDISDKLIINLEWVVKNLPSYTIQDINDVGEEFNGKSNSIYKFLADICEKNNMLLMALPSMYGLTFDETGESIKDMFRPIPYNEAKRMNNKSSTYVALYTYKLSEFLDIKSESGRYGFKNDGCDIADSRGNILAPVPAPFADGDENSMVVPAFGVTFAKQNQSYFKNIQLDMADHQQTEASLRTMFNIAAKGSQTPRSTQMFGQDLYRVYSSYSYMCSVDMMGNSQIMPLMYFQLNNIPMWNGLYMIIKVTHNINGNGDMTTNFMGVRISKYSTPYIESDFIYIDDDFPEDEKFEEEEEQTSDVNTDGTKGDNKAIATAHEKYQKVYSQFVKGNEKYDGSNTGGQNVYPKTQVAINMDYLASKGYNSPIDESIVNSSSYNGYKYGEGQKRTVKYLIVHSSMYPYEEAVMNKGAFPPYNIYIDGEGMIHYPWFHLGNKETDTNMCERDATTSSKNYRYCSMNLAFFGTYGGGKVNISDATLNTLYQYLLAFHKVHPNVKIVGYNQIGYAENDGNTLSPGFHMPLLLTALGIREAALYTDMDNFMTPCSNDRTYIDGNNASNIYNAETGEWRKQKEEKKKTISGIR